MVVACPYCEAEQEVATGVTAAQCTECKRQFPVRDVGTVACPGCGCDLTVPPGVSVVLCGSCRARVDVTTGQPVQPSTTPQPTPAPSGEARSATPHEETSVILGHTNFEEVRLQSVQAEFGERYEVLEPVGKGGMGAVFKARQRQPERLVVLKVMLSGRFASRKYRVRFEREAQAVARLKHPGIVSVYEYGEVNGQPYFTMEYVEGCDVREYVLRHKLDKHEICELMLKISRAVAYAHQRGVIHRDIKPSNILVDGQGNPRLLDFGLARLADGHWDEDPDMTEHGEVMGTPSYMSPEQTIGRAEEIDLRSDVYSIGVLFYELVTGALPYRIDRKRPLESLRIVRDYVPRRPSTVNEKLDSDLDAIVMKCLEKERELRYQSAIELAEDINRYLTGKPVEARPSTSFYHLRKLMWRHRNVFLPVAAGVLVGLVMNVVFICELIKSERRTRASYMQAVERDQQILKFVEDLKAVRRTVDDLILQGRWEEAYDKALFAEKHFADAGYEGYAEQVRARIAGRTQGEFERISKLIADLQFKEARDRIRQLKNLAEHTGLEQLAEAANQAEASFGEDCWQSLFPYIQGGGGSAPALEKFLAECPDSSHEQEARELLQRVMGSIRFAEWPFDEEEAERRRQLTARVMELPSSTTMPLDGGAQLQLVLIPAGEFLMGADEGSVQQMDNVPQHRVRITRPFFASATEITREQYEAVTGRLPAGSDEAPDMPAVVSWGEAQDFCAKLSRRSGMTVRLPTEAEWEYMCRAGSSGPYTHGVNAQGGGLDLYGWYADNSSGAPRPVGRKLANVWGLHDVHGNAQEWCSDWYDARYYHSSPVEDPMGPTSGAYRVMRGGSFRSAARALGAAVRTAAEPSSTSPTYGFRVCVEHPTPGAGEQADRAIAVASQR